MRVLDAGERGVALPADVCFKQKERAEKDFGLHKTQYLVFLFTTHNIYGTITAHAEPG